VRDSGYAGMGTRVDGMSGSHITPLGCSGKSSLLVKIATIHMQIAWS
jgi:hypothetical protein